MTEGLAEEASGCGCWIVRGALSGAVIGAALCAFAAWKLGLPFAAWAGGGALGGVALGILGAIVLRSWFSGFGPGLDRGARRNRSDALRSHPPPPPALGRPARLVEVSE